MDKRIPVSVFEDNADRFPNRIAVEAPDATLTYRELDRAANTVSNGLIACGFPAGEIAAVFIPNSATYILAIIGIQKACGVFMPADPNAPEDRQTKMFAKAEPDVVIVDEERLPVMRHFMEQSGIRPRLLMIVSEKGLLSVEIEGKTERSTIDENRPGLLPGPDDDCYVIFTSGTTGTPKAVLGRQKGLAHFVAWEKSEFGFDETLRASNLAPTTFDVSLRDIFTPLCSGGTVVVPAENIKMTPALLLDWLAGKKISLVHIVPSVFRLLVDECEKRPDPRVLLMHVRYFMLAGEAVYGRDVIRFRAIAGSDTGLVNLYGPTETTLAKLFHRIDYLPENPSRIMPLGNPISNTAVIIIAGGRLAEIGEIGEIYIKTPFRSKGYFRDPTLTAAAFVVNPLTGDAEDILYRTGDMGRYLPDRSVEFAGRLDRQVKVNGVRVELSEIDEATSSVPGVRQALVMPHVRDNGETSLICYYTEEKPVDTKTIREHLASSLYSAMIPSFYVRMDAFPLGINGKIDRRALPKPDEIIYEQANYTPPENETEVRLAAIWSDILGIRKVGVTTSFGALGGGSMQAIRCVGSISRAFGIDMSIRDFFTADTIRALAGRIGSDNRGSDAPIPRQPERPDYPATHSQKRLWMLHTMLPGFTAYNIAVCYRITGDFDEKAFERAFDTIVGRHEILHTVFFERGGELRQRVLPPSQFRLDHPGKNSNSADLPSIADHYARHVFDLEQGPLLRAGVLDDASGKRLIFVIHHIICDAWSLDIILRETLTEYRAIMTGTPSSLTPPALQYRDFAAWQNTRLNAGDLESQRTFWLDMLKKGLPRLDLPLDKPRPPRRTYRGAIVMRVMPEELPSRAREFAASHGTTLFAVLLAGLRLLLHRYSGQNEIVLNSPVTLRGKAELEAIPGDFTNTVLLTTSVEGGESFTRMTETAARDLDNAMANREYPFDRLIQELDIKGDLSRGPITDVGITLVEDYGGGIPECGFSLEPVEMDEGISKYDAVFHFSLSSEGLKLAIEYDTAIFHKDRIERMADNLASLILDGIARPEAAASELTILSPAERALIGRFQRPRPRNYADSTIHGAFSTVAEMQPEAPALVKDNETIMSFAELDKESNRIAAMLADKGYGKGSRIAVHLSRSYRVPLIILSILKAGAVYVPVADDLPKARIDHILKDSGTVAAFSEDGFGINLPADIPCLSIDGAASYPDTPRETLVSPEDEAYIIYTSGSTGKPKGVLLPHSGLVNRARDLGERAGITASDRFTQFASLSFDASIYEMFCSLLNGASLAVVTRDTISDTDEYLRFLDRYGITFTLLPPTYLRRLEHQKLAKVRILKTAGEAADVVDSLYYAQTILCLNGYGPTEDSVCSTIFTIDPARSYPLGIPIGTPVGDTEALVLDRHFKPVPIGVNGQLCVSDKGLALGYINMPETTAKSFISHPADPSRKMYLTGDLARWESDGNLLFMGRMDNQVKIGGHRIELGEIEHAIRESGGIIDVCVITTDEARDPRLAAYYTGAAKEGDVRTRLATVLPSYMIPHFFIHMDELPLSLSGKIDRKALPSVDGFRTVMEIREGTTDGEKDLLSVIRDVLSAKSLGIDANFFTSGGDSIRAIQAVARLREQGWSLSAGDFFVAPVLADLARAMTRASALVSSEPVTGEIAATPILSWFKETVVIHPEHFNQAVMLKSGLGFDVTAMKEAFGAVWRHHDVLRMVYEGNVFRIREADAPFELTVIECGSTGDMGQFIKETAEEAQRSFDLTKGPLFKSILFRRPGNDRLLLIAHHLVIDAVSWGILVRDIETAYHQVHQGLAIDLPPKTHSFKDWGEALRRFTLDGGFDSELPYWQAIVDTPSDRIGQPENHSHVMATIATHLNNVSSYGLSDGDGSESMLAKLLAGLASALGGWKPVERIRVQLEAHGRGLTIHGLDISRTVGWFTVSYPFLLDCHTDQDIQTTFETTRRALKEVPSSGTGYGALRYLAGHDELTAMADISFNYLGHIELPDNAFSLAEETVGETVNPDSHLGQTLEFLLSVTGDRMEIQMTYDTGAVAASDAEELLERYRKALATALACRTQDFDFTGFGESGLDGFLNSL